MIKGYNLIKILCDLLNPFHFGGIMLSLHELGACACVCVYVCTMICFMTHMETSAPMNKLDWAHR